MKHLIIIGARGWGREIYYAFLNSSLFGNGGYDVKGFLDDKSDALDGLIGDWPPIIGSVEEYQVCDDDVFFCAMGDSKWREHYAEIIMAKGGRFINIIDPCAWVNPTATLGEGLYIGPFTLVSANVYIGNQVIIQAYCNVGHDVVVGSYSSIESYVFLGGGASVGEMSVLHTKASIIPHKSIGNNCIVGINSVVMRNFKDNLSLFGNPALKVEL